MKNTDLGFSRDQVIYLRMSDKLRQSHDAFKTDLLKNPEITDVSVASSLPSHGFFAGVTARWDCMESDAPVIMYLFSINPGYLNMFGLDVTEGKNLTVGETPFQYCLVNETAAKLLSTESALGKTVKLGSLGMQVKGVIQDYHFESLHNEIKPLLIINSPNYLNYAFVKIKADNSNPQNVLGYIETVFKRLNPSYPFEFHFLDEDIERQYRLEEKQNKVVNYFTFLAIFISCLGLFGLVSYMAESRTKVIGIRKALGAHISNIIRLVSKEFLVLVILSNLIAWPAAYYFMGKWLEKFAYRTGINPLTFVFSAAVVLMIAMLTVSYQAVKAARMNPVDSLRNE